MTTLAPVNIRTVRCTHRLPLPLGYVSKTRHLDFCLTLEKVLINVFPGRICNPHLRLLYGHKPDAPAAVWFETEPLTPEELALIEMELVGWIDANRKGA